MMAELYYLRDDIRSTELEWLYGDSPPSSDDISEKYYHVKSIENWTSSGQISGVIQGMLVCRDCWIVLDDHNAATDHTIGSHPEEGDYHRHIEDLRSPKDGDVVVDDQTYILRDGDWIPEGDLEANSRDLHRIYQNM